MTAAQMIDITRMRTLYVHKETNPEIEGILQVEDDNEPLLAEIGQVMIDGDVEKFAEYNKQGKIKPLPINSIPETNAVYCLYLPPYYIFTDLKREYK